jgi:hypothetical protein
MFMNTNNLSKICTDCKQEFEISSGDLDLYNKVGLEIPAQCFFCRIKQHFGFIVFGKFRKGKSALSGENLITVLPERSRYPIYKSHEWWGDAWDPISFGQDYDSSRGFFEQLKELQEKIPRAHQTGENSTNCDWCDDVWESKNCYLCRSLLKCENCSYLYRVIGCKDSFDLAYCFNLQNSYDCLFCHDSFNVNFCENSRDCIDSSFLFDCRNCQNCFMSWNLRNKSYVIRNKQYTKEAYEVEMSKIKLDSDNEVQNLRKEFENILKTQVVHRENFNLRTTNSTGNYLSDCDKCVNCFSWEKSQNCRNHIRGMATKDSIDQTFTWNTELSGNNSGVFGGFAIKHSSWSDGRYSEYLDNCVEVEYCFGCVGLRKKKYCILNKQYTKEEYEVLKERIVSDMKSQGEYGKFLPYSMGLCEYNFSTGMIYFPNTTKQEILENGGYWLDEDLSSTDGTSPLELPDSIKDTGENVSGKALICPNTKYRFNISSDEYNFHKRKNLALPRNHFDFRMLEKIKKMAIIKDYPYKCFYCKKDINAYYPLEWNYKKVACEDCYKQNIA